MADDASDYPAALDTFTTLPALRDGPPTESDYHDKYQDALVNIETELGVNVRHRLGRTFADETARDAAITSPALGDRAFLTNKGRGTFYGASTWWPIPQIASGLSNVTFSSGVGQITFGVTFSANPVLSAQIFGAGAGPFTTHVQAISTTAATLKVFASDVAHDGVLTVTWIAVNGTAG